MRLYALNLNDEGRILSATLDEYGCKSNPRVKTLPDGDLCDYLYVGGKYVYSPLPVGVVKEAPSQMDVIEAQILYTAMMTNTLLEV